MKYLIIPMLVLGLLFALLPAKAGANAFDDQMIRIERATTVIQDIMATPEHSIPANLWSSSFAIAVFPDVVKAALGIGGASGDGVFIIKQQDGTWGAPSFITLRGASLGAQIGAEISDVVLVFMTPGSVMALGRGDLTLGATVSVAAGPVGRTGVPATNNKPGTEILSYSRTRGLFAGIALDGDVVRVDNRANLIVYSTSDPFRIAAENIPEPAKRFRCTLASYTGAPLKACA